MGLIVQKFGGTSMGSVERIRHVAERVIRSRDGGKNRVVVVVSAIGGETDRLVQLGESMRNACGADLGVGRSREVDVLLSTGEQVSAALLSMALCDLGVPARSMLGHQVRILTDRAHSRARIRSVESQKLQRSLDLGEVAVVPGFQGIDPEGNITTLGRGGSDTTAVALAAATRADVCEIYTDVEGVFTTDPNVCRAARKIKRISYEEMLELSSLGAKVLQIRSVELARKYGVKLHVRSTFSKAEGTWVVEEEQALESVVVSGVASDKNETKFTVRELPDSPGVVARIFEPLAEQNICVDMIIQNVSVNGTTDMTFTVTKADVQRAKAVVQSIVKAVGAKDFLMDEKVVKVSVVGLGMRSHAGIAAKVFRILAAENVNVQAISTSEIKVSCLIHSKYGELAVRALHEGFELGKGSVPPPPA